MKNKEIAVIGGDRRTACMAQILAEQGNSVVCYKTPLEELQEDYSHLGISQAKSLCHAVDNAPIVICGIPMEYEGTLNIKNLPIPIATGELQRCLRKNQKLFAGMIPEEFRDKCEERQIHCFDFTREEPLSLFQSIATAEGAIAETLLHSSRQLHHSNALVLGFGRCGKTIASKLSGLSAKVNVCSFDRNETASAQALGFLTIPPSSLGTALSGFEFIYNTIPACILNEALLRKVSPDVCIIDIASHRIGVDYDTCEKMGLNAIYCPHLPGKYASRSCAERLVDFVLEQSTS